MKRKNNYNLQLIFWGVRGSLPVPGKDTVKYGGNTPCISVETEDSFFIFDAGTGIRNLSQYLLKNKKTNKKFNIFFTHYHYDHIIGFPFFVPAFSSSINLNVYGPLLSNLGLNEIFSFFLKREFFPVKLNEIKAKIKFFNFSEEENFSLGKVKIKTILLNHPNYSVGYSMEYAGKKIVYLTDTEMVNKVVDISEQEVVVTKIEELRDTLNMYFNKLVDFADGADILIFDSQYTEKDYLEKKGWGHSTFSDALKVAAYSKVKKLFFFHYDPSYSDKFLEKIYQELKEEYDYYFKAVDVYLSREKMKVVM